MGNIVGRVGIEPTSLALTTDVLTITPPRLPDITIRGQFKLLSMIL